MALRQTPADRFTDVEFPAPAYIESVDGEADMAYVDVGTGDETFLCLHGEPTWGYLYRKMLPPLRELGRVVVPDFIGFGRSDKYTDVSEYSFEGHYETLVAFVETLDLSGITLICQDWGAILGLPYAVTDAPNRFDRIVASNALLTDGEIELADQWYAFRDMVLETDEFAIGRLIEGACVRGLDPADRAAYEAPFSNEASKAGAYAWPPMVPQDPDMPGADRHAQLREDLADFDTPFFAVFSDADPITDQYHDLFRELVPTAAEQPDVRIENAGHFVQEDAGAELADEIRGFVERTP